MILSAQSIRGRTGLLEPFHERTVFRGMTFGLSPAGYDIRIAEDAVLRPGAFQLASSMERFAMPLDLIAFVKDKSTWARRGLFVQNTVIEPGWSGYLTLELTSSASEPLELNAGMPIAQIVFQLLDKPTDSPYRGKYQNQRSGPVPARLDPGCG
ncbi:MAG: dCTP deaminase [Bacteroidota bacterium]